MKILICSLNFYPELTGIGKYSGEMASWLASQGHEVHVIAAPPYYPNWSVNSGYSSYKYVKEQLNSVVVWRCPLWVPGKPRGISRLLHLGSFAVSVLPIMFRQIFWRPDVVWVVAPAFFCSPAALFAARLSGAKAWLHIQDFEVDAAFEMGLLKGRYLRYLVTTFERWIFQKFDIVSTISQRMVERLGIKGVAPQRTVLFPNWVDISTVHPKMRCNDFRRSLDVSDDQVLALYSGNMGAKQGLNILSSVARILKDKNSLVFVFCGTGAGRDDLMAQCSDLSNVRFLDLQPIETLGTLLSSADIHLLPQKADAADLVMPSKLTGMLASGRPVVATAHLGTELARVVVNCGIITEPDHAEGFAAAIEYLADNPDKRGLFGHEARRYAENNLDVKSVIHDFELKLFSIVGKV